jgi:Rps23 Pro-64 3,4-dihydroxylase Tpa1-like proline 4-hydroxylase
MGEHIRHLLAQFNSAAFLDFLKELTGIAALIPDPYFEGGGMHQIVRGGHLNVHVDFNRHPLTGLDRRLNVLLYLNRDWQVQWGGAFELWSGDGEQMVKRVPPLFNRLVVFSTTEISYHGHPHPLACPEDRTRRSLALYYYSNGRPEEGGSKAATHNTLWAGEERNGDESRSRAKHLVKRWAPPAVLDAARAARRRTGS